MLRLSNLKLRTQLGAAFLCIVALAVALGGFSLLQLSRVHASTHEIASYRLPSIKVADEINLTMNEIRRSELVHYLAEDETGKARQEQFIAGQRQRLAQQLQAYEPLARSAEERQALDEFKQAVARYWPISERMLTLSRAGLEGKAELNRLLGGDSFKTFNQIRDALAQLTAINSRAADAARAEALGTYESSRSGVIGVLVALVAVASALAAWMTRQITRPLAQAIAVAERIADGDLTVQTQAQGRDETAQLLHALGHMRERLVSIVQGVRGSAQSVATASAQIAQGNGELSGRTESQASALEQTAASMEQLGSAARLNADHAHQANGLAQTASTVARQGGDTMAQVVATMQGISDSASRIADIIGTIDAIAFQTNILALNAAVEAARAGEQGRGFAVVAGEVRTLAQRSAEAAKEIKALIGASLERVGQGSLLVAQAGATMREVVASIGRVTDIVGEINTASREQSAGVSQVGEAVAQMDQATQQNAALVEESAAAAASLRQQAQQLVQAMAVFRVKAEPVTA